MMVYSHLRRPGNITIIIINRYGIHTTLWTLLSEMCVLANNAGARQCPIAGKYIINCGYYRIIKLLQIELWQSVL